MIVRNDDVHVATDVDHLAQFCSIVDQAGFQIIHGVTPIGDLRSLYEDGLGGLSNEEISARCGRTCLLENHRLINFLGQRRVLGRDAIGLHGWEHHRFPLYQPMEQLWMMQLGVGFLEWLWRSQEVRYFVAPFNQIDVNTEIAARELGLMVLAEAGANLEAIVQGIEDPPTDSAAILRCHSWRFGDHPPARFSWSQLKDALRACTSTS